MAKIIRFPAVFRGRPKRGSDECPRRCAKFQDATRQRLRTIIAALLAILDSLEGGRHG